MAAQSVACSSPSLSLPLKPKKLLRLSPAQLQYLQAHPPPPPHRPPAVQEGACLQNILEARKRWEEGVSSRRSRPMGREGSARDITEAARELLGKRSSGCVELS
ncbi:hypothetical protein GUITHDRAFT_112219 [Guillardia theta CCMP2712]|uniref:Uncharacterized protein n=1 Tax=Guillardia theta (strain CCMP2712) TaxID=905079 RepID=L1J005_GUITC|nr:hypothetical protein GUITHDRAFT_112215 [Guillardia theta CCMP2712]XP_005828781.1 hypothetical protein GUITHDRAFT_112219 [Guillardia theta CCMP2712]EKX41797.1 hypothetical protein GUITHDRAFT_112215 [Guillardia theta CCMP2712]EKX41801.1 hypothetical protein GUITHDRAFT_112219 [Guillardia theta CCMP2712]|eukprot:XP_005828777.1 hypothetical protein GUITHDRAFT_112215 [Guillardia theta CCMP2712]